jgi:hypothetical protein
MGEREAAVGGGKAVLLGLAIVFAGPVGGEPAAVFEAMECGIWRALLDFEDVSEVRSMTLAMVWPFASPVKSVRRIIMSSVPLSMSSTVPGCGSFGCVSPPPGVHGRMPFGTTHCCRAFGR